jgi:hypothetical protein
MKKQSRGYLLGWRDPTHSVDFYAKVIYMWTLVGLVFGCVLFIFGFGAAGMGHGTYLPMAVYGAPFSAVPLVGMFATPVWWTALGWTISSRRRTIALGMLAANILGAALFATFGTPWEQGEEQWKYFDQAQATFPVRVWGGLASYSAILLLFLNAAFLIRSRGQT